ncbi:Crp/Fnr family transcriptional regulator [Sunxiuqinia elliptica]|uniref:cAMP-binding domain of CRP or a regulatory subunit of cAMP-dependent protein kinases n=1 Tax=Sunxiuqinia elliptica TaxID=655355 RepID=A0A1I2C6L5_9BACT|nr:Crp/Fnr family transcriptional regulator [Sunxiuqinia elliptica]SFE63979.1 cAMP-binding domain of CRP or a regulatory subunit of cAMP-dependent protein kinases [Sunxiuqinia elliptica]
MEIVYPTGSTCINELRVDEKAELFDSGRYLDFKQGELVVKKGAPVHDLYLIQDGTVELTLDDERTKKSLMLLFSGEIIGINCAYSTRNYRFSARALTDCKVLIIDYQLFSRLLTSNPRFSMAFIQYISMVNENFLNWHMKLTERNSAGALAFLLCEFEKSYGQRSFELPLTRSDMARVIGFSKESVLKNLADFRKEGLVESEGRKITIVDLARLQDISTYG